MILAIDHVVILVADLGAAAADYAALGFTVTPGGAHAGGRTHNALVAFADGSYLELLAFLPPPAGQAAWPGDAGLSPLSRRWLARAAAGEGLLDFAVLPGAMAADVAAARAWGLALEGPFPGGRRRPDGQAVAWETALAPTPDLPFLCGDVTPRDLRVPPGAARQHANGVQEIAGVLVAVDDVGASAGRYAALLGGAPRPAAVDGLPVFAVGQGAIGIVSLADYFAAAPDAAAAAAGGGDRGGPATVGRGEGPVRLLLRGAVGAPPGEMDIRLAHGARLTVVGGDAPLVFR